jgi:predicted nucleic acid-binding protein
VICVDASVFVSAVREAEEYYAGSRQFLQRVREQAVDVVCPTLILPECAAAIARATNNSALAEGIVDLVESFAGLRLVSFELSLARRAAQIATAHRLRGADAVYVAVAEMFGISLVAWDNEILRRAPAVVPTMTPIEWLAK